MMNLLKNWRVARGLKVIDAAAAVDVTPGMWSRWENGRRPLPIERAIDLEAKIGIPRHDLRPDIFLRPTEAAE